MSTGYFSYIGITSSGVSKLISPWEGLAGLYSAINLVFVLFIVSEISKLTNNFLSLPVEYTFSSYAREGFFQLLFVTLINFSIIISFCQYILIL